MSLRILFVIHDLDVAVGGMERQARLLAAALLERGHQVTALTFPLRPSALPRREERAGLRLIRIQPRLGVPPGVTRELRRFEAAAALLRARWDVIYAVHFTGAAHALQLREVLGAPVAVKAALSGPRGDFELSRREDPGGFAALCAADRLVCINSEVEAEALAAGLPQARCARIRNGIDLGPYRALQPASREALGLEPADRVLLCVGRLSAQKRLDVVLLALAEALAAEPRLCLLLAGEGEARAALGAQAEALGISTRVRFLGPRADVSSLLALAEGFVLASESEGISNALLEALAAGTPAIVSRNLGNLEVVRDPESGESAALLVEVDDAPGLAEAMIELLADPEGCAQRVTLGHARLQREFQLQVVAERYEALFTELAAEARPRRAPAGFTRRNLRHTLPYAGSRAQAFFWLGIGEARRAISGVVVRGKRALGREVPLQTDDHPDDHPNDHPDAGEPR